MTTKTEEIVSRANKVFARGKRIIQALENEGSGGRDRETV